MYLNIETFCISSDEAIINAVAKMDVNRLGIILAVDGEGRLVGTVTDGDVRRAILAKLDFKLPLHALVTRKKGSQFEKPITGLFGADRESYRALMQRHRILHLPLLDEAGRVRGLVTFDEFVASEEGPRRAVVMAGGAGTRLSPLTDHTPKPMLPVGDRPLMEIILDHLKQAGVRRVSLSTHRYAEQIESHFKDGADFGLEVSYLEEERPLGTAGALAAIADASDTDTLLVMNGDILTHIDFRAMMRFHREHQADLTVAVRQYEFEVPYGVVECAREEAIVTGVVEKPVYKFFVNAGIYLIEPAMCRYVPGGERFDMTDLIARLLADGRTVVSFPIREYWLDIGRPPDYARAQEDVKAWKRGAS